MPKKRGPKTDVLEALLKRVDGLEAKLKEKKDQPTTMSTEKATVASATASGSAPAVVPEKQPPSSVGSSSDDTIEVKQQPLQPVLDTAHTIEVPESAVYTPSPSRCADYPSDVKGFKCIRTVMTDRYSVPRHRLAFNPTRFSIRTSPGFTPNPSTSSMSRPFGNGSS